MEPTAAQKLLGYDAMAAHVTVLDEETAVLRRAAKDVLAELDRYGEIDEDSPAVAKLRRALGGNP